MRGDFTFLFFFFSSLVGISQESITKEPIHFIILRDRQLSQGQGQTTKIRPEVEEEGKARIVTEKANGGNCYLTGSKPIAS